MPNPAAQRLETLTKLEPQLEAALKLAGVKDPHLPETVRGLLAQAYDAGLEAGFRGVIDAREAAQALGLQVRTLARREIALRLEGKPASVMLPRQCVYHPAFLEPFKKR